MEKMRVKMLRTMQGADDDAPNVVNLYKKDETYEVGPDLGGVFLREKWAHKVKPKEVKPEKEATETKDEGAAPENK